MNIDFSNAATLKEKYNRELNDASDAFKAQLKQTAINILEIRATQSPDFIGEINKALEKVVCAFNKACETAFVFGSATFADYIANN